MSKNEEDRDQLRRELAQNGIDIGYVQALGRIAGTATPETDARLSDLAERNVLALRASGGQVDPQEFKRRVQLRRRMEAAKKRAASVRASTRGGKK
jgi:hypothetical protein